MVDTKLISMSSLLINTMTPITNGISTCCCNVKAPLITTTYREGAGDTGYTATSPSARDMKDDSTVVKKLWARLSRLQISIAKTTPLFIEEDTRTCLDWVWSNVRSLSSLAYLEGASDTHAFPTRAISYMEEVIRDKKDIMGPSPSFIQWEHVDLLEMEDLWAEVRDTETMYHTWAHSTDINDAVRDRIQTVLTILNRLSSYLWWCMRHENKLRGCRELVWQGYVTPFPL